MVWKPGSMPHFPVQSVVENVASNMTSPFGPEVLDSLEFAIRDFQNIPEAVLDLGAEMFALRKGPH